MMLVVLDLAAVREMGDPAVFDLEEPKASPVQAPPPAADDEDDRETEPSASASRSAAMRDFDALQASLREPGPGGPRLATEGPHHARPLPILRATHTVSVPWDHCPVTFELVVLSAHPADDDHTASIADVPELSQGGWSNHSFGPLDVFTRMIC
jgi:hypothetical protein